MLGKERPLPSIRETIAGVNHAISNGDVHAMEGFLKEDKYPPVNPVAKDRAWGVVLKYGGTLTVGVSLGLGIARALEAWAQRKFEEVMDNPFSVPPKRVHQVGEKAVQSGRGSEFAEKMLNALDVRSNDEKEEERLTAAKKKLLDHLGSHSQVTALFFTADFLRDLNSEPRVNEQCARKLKDLRPENRKLFDDFAARITRSRNSGSTYVYVPPPPK